MRELGMKADIFNRVQLEDIPTHLLNPCQRPTRMPRAPTGKKIIAGFALSTTSPAFERMLVCETLEDMQEIFDAYARGGAMALYWYFGEDPGFLTVINLTPPKETNP